MADVALSDADRAALEGLTADLRQVFGRRLSSIAAYGHERPLHTLVLVDRIGFEDLAACAPLTERWHRHALATPLVLSRHEFLRTLDVFPVEYGAIIDNHVVVFGTDPFAGCAVCEADLRRAVELQAKSHLIHLREGFLEADGHPDAVARLIAASVPAYRSLIENLARLNPGGANGGGERLMTELSSIGTIAEPTALFARYVAEVERIWEDVDRWR